LLSTTDSRGTERGQVLVLFAGGLVTIMLVAALAFDTGVMLVERRDQQNAADSAAIAGARWLPGDTSAARNAAEELATANGFTDGLNSANVDISIPPVSGAFAGQSGYIQVQISSTRPSIFAGVMDVGGWQVGASAVAVNQNGVGAPFAMLSLDPSGCDALLVTGNGSVVANGNIQVNSTCSDGALHRGGGGDITVTAPGSGCNVVGDIKDPGNNMNCVKTSPAPAIPDPLAGLAPPAIPALPAAPVLIAGTGDIPDGCPGAVAPSTPASDSEPATCQFTSSYDGTVWRLFPGYYPGGIKLQGGTFYLEPGIYYIGGGGFTVTGTGATAISVSAGGTTLGGGILIYNTEASEFHDECVAGTGSPEQCLGQVILNGAEATIDLYSLDNGSAWDGLVIFQDRNLTLPGVQDEIVVNGSSSNTQVRGTIYAPTGDVKVNGSGGTVTTDQVIAFRFQINGAPGSVINVLYDEDFIFELSAAGLVE
jgi:Flp pilus assembly protein TadG